MAPCLSLEPFVDPLLIPARILHNGSPIPVVIQQITRQLHSSLPPTTLWSYGDKSLAPTIEVRRNQPLTVQWVHRINDAQTLPIKVVTESYVEPATNLPAVPIPQNSPGSANAQVVAGTDKLKAHMVVHLHGGRTEADSDGWPDNVIEFGQTQTSHYQNDQRARMLWYHDHAMSVTRLNVYAGLAGLYLIRDDEEDHLNLPTGDHEIPLLIVDRNFETKADGTFTGQLLHKTETGAGVMEFFGPYTLVNGTVWPHHEVKAESYRLRLLNGSNARTYRLVFCREVKGDWEPIASTAGFIKQIGTDAGLLAQAVDVPGDGLVLASAERADLMVDFSQFPGEKIRIYNTAKAPFDGSAYTGAPDAPALDDRRPCPQVMEFRVRAKNKSAKAPYKVPSPLSSFRWKSHSEISHAKHRLVALVEKSGRLELHEMCPVSVDVEGRTISSFNLSAAVPADDLALKTAVDDKALHKALLLSMIDTINGQDIATVYYSAAGLFYDKINFMIDTGSTEVWRFINLSPDTHPMHIHLADSQPLMRKVFVPVVGFNPERDSSSDPQCANLLWKSVAFNPNHQPDPLASADFRQLPHSPKLSFDDPDLQLDHNEKALKDTVRINPGEMFVLAAEFKGHSGRFMYHCHVLEHEDHEMMRPIIVLPRQLRDQMQQGDPRHHEGQ